MKYIALLIFLLVTQYTFSQNIPTIKASEASSYVGQLVYLKDSIRSGIIVTDSMAILKVGGKLDKDIVSVVISSRGSGHSLDKRVTGTLRVAGAGFKGVVIPAQSSFILFIDKQDNIKFNGPLP